MIRADTDRGGSSWTRQNSNRVFRRRAGSCLRAEPGARRLPFRKIGGKSWQKNSLSTIENTGAIDLAFEPGNPRKRIYATLVADRPGRPPVEQFTLLSNGPGRWPLSLKVTEGDHWDSVTGQGLPSEGPRPESASLLRRANPRADLFDRGRQEAASFVLTTVGKRGKRVSNGPADLAARVVLSEEVPWIPKILTLCTSRTPRPISRATGGKTFHSV